MQALCLVHDRQVISQQQSQQYNPYYNLSTTNACTLQAVTANTNLQLPNQMSSYAPFANNQLPHQTQLFPNSTQTPILNQPRETRPSASVLDFPPLKYPRSKLNAIASKIPTAIPVLTRENTDWPPPIGKMSTTFNIPSSDYKDFCAEIVQNSQANSSSKTLEERFSDESSASFDFTIEAEKMVSALCNTTSSNDLAKVGTGKNESSTVFSGAGDNVSGKETWFSDYPVDNATVDISSDKSVGTQTQEPNSEKYAELIRKTTLLGCSQAESLLNSGKCYRDYKNEWLANLSAATRTAITKSATCFPVFTGDRTFVQDLISSLLRISNGWLILDNYLNKQHYPNLNDKYDRELIKCFQDWEGSTHELLKNVIKTFLQLEEKISGQEEKIDTPGTSGTFPGDISMYTTYDLFESPLSQTNLAPGSSVNQETSHSFHNFHYLADQKKETKLKGKWTITENVSSGMENSKNPDVSLNRLDAGIHVSRIRTKGNVSSIKSTSLNAEFFHLRNKVLENRSPDGSKWHLKERKQDFNINRTFKPSMDSVFRLKFGNENQDACSSQLPRIDPIFSNSPENMDPLYVNTNSSNYPTCIGKKGCFDPNCESNLGQMLSNSVYLGNSSSDQMEFAGIPINKMTLLSQIEPNTAVTNKEEMTANLSAWFASMRNVNITGNLDLKVENLSRNSQEITRNKMDLTRQLQMDGNRQLLSLQNMQSIQSAPWNACNLLSNRASVQQTHEEYDSSEDTRIYMKPGSYNVPKKRHQKRSNRRSENTASRLGIRNLNKDRSDPSTSFASSRVVTMNKIDTNSSSNLRITFPTNPVTSPRILHKSNSPSEDVTWKAACASAEILLEALNVKESSNLKMEEEQSIKGGLDDQKIRDRDQIFTTQDQIISDQDQRIRDQIIKNQEQMIRDQKIRDQMVRSQDEMIRNQDQVKRNQGQKQRRSKSRKQREEDDGDASSYEASEDDSESSGKMSHGMGAINLKRSSDTKLGKSNVKTDSWLIRTLNNASIMGITQCREDELASSDSLNSSLHEDEQIENVNVVASALTTPAREKIRNISPKKLFPNFLKKEGSNENVGKATYSETVRRSAASNLGKKEPSKKGLNSENESMCGTILPLPGKKSHRKDVEKSYLLHKSRKAIAKKILKDQEVDVQREENLKTKNTGDEASLGGKSALGKGHGKRKDATVILDGKNKTADRGWSVWYSSKRKQMSPLALSKLEAIHQTVWQMEESFVFKYPSSTGPETSSSNMVSLCFFKIFI